MNNFYLIFGIISFWIIIIGIIFGLILVIIDKIQLSLSVGRDIINEIQTGNFRKHNYIRKEYKSWSSNAYSIQMIR
jgi:hypothetical protein